jgi:hypothetical protein
MLVVSASRSRARTMKEAMYSSAKLRSRLASKRESGSLEEGADDPSYLRRKSEQGKGR